MQLNLAVETRQFFIGFSALYCIRIDTVHNRIINIIVVLFVASHICNFKHLCIKDRNAIKRPNLMAVLSRNMFILSFFCKKKGEKHFLFIVRKKTRQVLVLLHNKTAIKTDHLSLCKINVSKCCRKKTRIRFLLFCCSTHGSGFYI